MQYCEKRKHLFADCAGKGGSVLVHVGTNNVEREGTTAIVRKYRQLVRTLKQTRVEQVILSGILPVMGRRGSQISKLSGDGN